jgi:hypothetical protein
MKPIILAIGFILFFNPVIGEVAIHIPPPKPQNTSVGDLITFYADRYSVSETIMHKVIKCESGYKVDAVGDGGTSFGLVQIHLPAHPYVLKDQAFDPDFAISFLAKNLARDKGDMWTCYRRITRV